MSAPPGARTATPFPPAPPLMTARGIADWSLENAKRRHVETVLEYCGGDVRWAANQLGVQESTLFRWRTFWQWLDANHARRPHLRHRRPRLAAAAIAEEVA